MKLEPLTLGERIVMIARIAAAEHVRQVVNRAIRVEQEAALRQARMAPGTFNDTSTIKPDPQEAA